MSKLTVKDVSVEGKKVFLRVDLNVPLSTEGEVLDDFKIRAVLPTIHFLLERDARLILASHLGRPKGKVVETLRMAPVARRISQLLGQEVVVAPGVAGAEVERRIEKLPPGGALLLENLRFEPGETQNDPALAEALSRLADLFVNDAFGTAHRAHASNCGISAYLPAVAGLLMERELLYLAKSRENPTRPMTAILGGKKVADKIGVIRYFMEQADHLLLGGAMANTFLRAQGHPLGNSLFEEDKLGVARDILQESVDKKAKIILPVDVVVAEELRSSAPFKVTGVENIPQGWGAVDLGPGTVSLFREIIAASKTVIWNGPLGAYEFPPFNKGTEDVAEAVAYSGAQSIIGGGDIVAALRDLGLAEKFTHLSTGGGAVLKYWEGDVLPGLDVLQEKSGAAR
ncbi:MAG TPA: phosphoglycerate kinase [Firmicutes bacterium]|nr:phosphoglycerate kinase [Bacillota bacterium]